MEVTEVETAEEEVKWFECTLCHMKEAYHTKEKKPKFLKNITFCEETYLIIDPFTPPQNKQFIVLGSDCCLCKSPVCQSSDCSIFYQKRYCQTCAVKKKNFFPEQLWSKIKDFRLN